MADPGRTARLIALGLLLAYAVRAVLAVWTVPFPNGYDELAHLSYVVVLAQTPFRVLDLAGMHLLRPTLEPGFGPLGNYLNHPPAFYMAMGALLPAGGWPDLGTVHGMRLVDAALSTAAVGLALFVGVLRRLEPRLMLLFGVSVVLVPVLQVTGSGISNDNLALLGGCLAVFGAQASVGGRRAGPWLLVVGCVLATLAKFTAAIMLGVFAGVFLLGWARTAGWRRAAGMLLALGLAELLAGLPYAWFAVRFGSPVPVTPAFLAVGADVAAARWTVNGWVPGQILGLPAYAVEFGRWLVATWSPVLGIGGWAGAAILLPACLMLAAALPALVANPPWWRGRDPVLGSGAVALLLTLVPHLVFSWQRYHLPFGTPPFDAVPRYYLPVALAVVPAAACWSLSRLPARLRTATVTLMLVATVAALPILSACHDRACW